MDGFGKRLKLLRGKRKAIDVARLAYEGEDASPETISNLSNYISRIERGDPDSQNPKLEMLERLARGFGLTLSSFFAGIEREELGHESGIKKSGGRPGDRAVHAVAAQTQQPNVQEELDNFGTVLGRLVHALARQQTPKARSARSSGRKSDREDR